MNNYYYNWGDEPHIDGDVRPTSRGTFVYMYVCIWPCGAFVLHVFPRSHVRVHIDCAHDVILTWRDSKQDCALETPGSTSTR